MRRCVLIIVAGAFTIYCCDEPKNVLERYQLRNMNERTEVIFDVIINDNILLMHVHVYSYPK
jgi:hypothetical protein